MRVFADSYYFIALMNPNDRAHDAAQNFLRHLQPMVTTRWVLAEVADAFAASRWRGEAGDFLAGLNQQPAVRILSDSDALYARGLDLYRSRPDKAWSLTDCISFVAMEREGLREALTSDRHFEQAGFTPLLTES